MHAEAAEDPAAELAFNVHSLIWNPPEQYDPAGQIVQEIPE